MMESRRRSYTEKVPVSPLKKVTFYGPVMKTKGEQLRHVGTQAMPSKQTLFSSSQPSRGRLMTDSNGPLNHLRSKSHEERPHSKTSVLGKQMKTRLSCNHTKQRCEACIANKKRSNKHKHRTLISDLDTSRQSHVIPSSRSHPRGGTDGRKLYDQNEGGRSLSILDANWKPGQDIYAERREVRSGSSGGIPDAMHENGIGSRQSSEDGVRKKVQFADRMTNNSNGELNTHPNNGNTAHYLSKQSTDWNNHQRKDKSLEHHVNNRGKVNSVGDAGNADCGRNFRNDEHHVYDKNSHSSDRDEVYDNTSTSDQDMVRPREKDDYCQLCESLRHHCSKHSKFDPRYLSARDRQFHERARTRSVPPQSTSSTEGDEPCLLCQRYGKKHYYIDDSDCCGLCEAPPRNRSKKFDYLLSSPANNATRRPPSHLRLTRPLHRRWSTPMFFSDGEEEDSVLKKSIPYEPKTEVVKDLKKKLEDEYLHREYLRKKKNFHRRWRSWDAEDLEELRSFRRHRCEDPWDHVPQHKCVHRFLQNDRLFLEPTLTDEDGSSLCSECGILQPKDYIRDPYLYHVTLGGLRNHDRHGKENVNRHFRDFLPNKKSQRASHQNTELSKRLPGDTSKHIFARLNRHVNNIFPLNSHYHLRPHLADELRYRVNPHTKRHPSKSMALIDHLL